MGISLKRCSARTLKAETVEQAQIELDRKIERLFQNINVGEALKEKFFVDDLIKPQTAQEYVRAVLGSGGEFYTIHLDPLKPAIGFHVVYDLIPGRKCSWGMYLKKEHRNRRLIYDAYFQLSEYLWRVFKLVKIQAFVSVLNRPAFAVRKLGFRLVGHFAFENFYNGSPSDTLAFEAYNPVLRSEPEEIIDERQLQFQQQCDGGGGTELRGTAGLQCDGATSGERDGLGESGVASQFSTTGGLADHLERVARSTEATV